MSSAICRSYSVDLREGNGDYARTSEDILRVFPAGHDVLIDGGTVCGIRSTVQMLAGSAGEMPLLGAVRNETGEIPDVEKTIRVKHTRETGNEVVRIYLPDESESWRIACWPIDTGLDDVEAAVEALWRGYEDTRAYPDKYGAESISLHSTVPGASEAFGTEYSEVVRRAKEEANDN